MEDARAEFEDVFDDLFDRAWRLAARLLGDRARAEDVAAEALARTWLHWDRVGHVAHRDAWVLRVTTNLALDAARRRRVLERSAPPSDHSDATVLRLALVAALRSLPRRQREVVVLRHLSDLPEAAVAQALGINPGTVGAHLHRGLAALRRRLGDDPEELRLAVEP